jgi:paraquat-inducible protein B
MKTVAHPRLIGLFVLLGLGLWTTIVILWGSGGFLSTLPRYLIYFDGSVNGLAAGSVVRLKGVSIGKVIEVKVRYNPEEAKILTPVVAEIDFAKVIHTESERTESLDLKALTAQGLRARLGVQSLVSNQLYVDLEFLPQTSPHVGGSGSEALPEIPTVTSNKEELEKTLEHVANEVRELPLRETVDAAVQVLRHTDQLLAKPETSASIDRLNENLVELKTLILHLDTMAKDGHLLVKQLNGDLPPLINSATETLKQAKASLASVNDLVQPESELGSALRDVSEAARAIRRLADTLERHPDAVLYGKKPADSK